MSRVNESGLVPVFLYQMVGKNFPRTVAGFMPDMAADLVAKGLATYDLTGGSHLPNAPAAPSGSEPGGAMDPAAIVQIPSDWESLHFLQQIKLAKRIAGQNAPNPMSKEEAVAVIAAEIARRANSEGVN
jgi:hypothetical protein